MKKFLIAIFIVLTVFTGCKFIPEDALGTVTVNVSGRNVTSRGIENVDMATSYYMVTIRNTDKNIDYRAFRVEKDGESIEKDVASGNTLVTVDAYNSDGIRIGSGSNTVLVKPMKNNTVNVTVNEIKGTAQLALEVTTAARGMNLTAKVVKAGDTPETPSPEATIALKAAEKGYTGSASVHNGTWMVYLNDGKNWKLLDTVRIVAGHDITMKTSIDDNWNITVEIVDSIVQTPEITISGGKTSYACGEKYTLSADISKITPSSIEWLLDGKVIPGAKTATLTGTIPQSGSIKPGNHSFTILVKKNEVVWTESHDFTIPE